MKRLFPRAVPQALIAMLLVSAACAPKSDVTPGAPVLSSLSIVDPSGSHLADVTGDTPNCAANAAEGQDCDPGTAVCELGANVVCVCTKKDMCDPTIKASDATTGGTLNCTFPPMSTVLAVFDRLLSTAPFDAGKSVALLSAMPTTTAKTSTDYTSSGATQGLVFPVFFGIPAGPSLVVSGAPALPASSTVTISLDKANVLAKDGKTPFTGAHLLADGIVAFKTSGFSASVTVPAPPAMDMGGSSAPMGCPDAGTMTSDDGAAGAGGDAGGDAATTEGGADGGTDAGATDAGTTDAVAIDAGTTDAVATEAGAIDAGTTDAGTTDAGTTDTPSEGGATTPPSTDVPLDMNTGTITITFTNPVDMSVLDHIKMTEDGQAFTDFVVDDMMMTATFPRTTVVLKPKTMWAAGKTYVVTVDKNAPDVLGATLGAAVSAQFTMSAN